MADPFVAEIRIFPFNFAPKGWALVRRPAAADLAEHRAVLAARAPPTAATASAPSRCPTCRAARRCIPARARGCRCTTSARRAARDGDAAAERDAGARARVLALTRRRRRPPGASPGRRSRARRTATPTAPARPALVALALQALAPAGGDQPHNNLQPYLTFNFNIALQGVFPPRG